MSEPTLSRRALLKQAASAAALLGLSGPLPAQSETVRTPRRLAPGEKLNLACVGCGGKGTSDIEAVSSENIVALCDVDWSRAKRVTQLYPNVPKFQDYRVMLREMDAQIDAVTVTTPDHMHFPIAKMAIEMGKHVYVQKPLTHSVWEARQLTELARRHRVATQMGNQGQAEESVRVLCEYLDAGAIGPVREVHVWTNRPIWPQAIERPKEKPPVPATLAWDLWLGVAPERPFHPAYHPFKWRGWHDFGTGALGDIGCHSYAPIQRALKLGPPTSVEAVSSPLYKETFPSASIVRYQFPARGSLPPVKLAWYDGGLKPERPPGLEPERSLGEGGTLYVGDKGVIYNGRLLPESRMREFPPPPKTLPRSPGHYEEWLLACKGGTPGGSNFDIAGPQAETILLGNIALLTKKRIEWDSASLRITNVPEANELLRPKYREGWGV
ncbi:MAG: Gfo/Idh/MocA family oxidoreductase [Verrucomicrobia bacterium]|nr:Gfo/Idh/MocA family oxidoreductase [Verrucomicrobiota bacterium]